MKQLPQSTRIHTDSFRCRALLDDIEEIQEAMREMGLEVSVRSGAFAFESVDELLARRGPRPGKLELVASPPGEAYPRVSVEFDGARVSYYASDTSQQLAIWSDPSTEA
jgi:hypothetical protein